MLRFFPVAAAVAGVLGGAAWAQTLPPGYQGVIQITNDAALNHFVRLNNRGQVVFSKRIDPTEPNTSEIYLYDNGVLMRLTDDGIQDDCPDINDAGEIVWTRRIGGLDTMEVVIWRQGQLTRLTYDDLDDGLPSINNLGWIAWSKWLETGCYNADDDIYLYDGQTIQQITYGGYQNAVVRLNDLGDLVWTRYNLCPWPAWESQIMLWSGGVAAPISGNEDSPQAPSINNRGVVAWDAINPPPWPPKYHITLWDAGQATRLTDWGMGAWLNERGDVAFYRWHDDTQTYQVWLYRDGEFWQITDDPFWNVNAEIDNYGNVVWSGGDPYTLDFDVLLLKRYPSGDMNCDGAVNALDIDPFVLALVNPAGYAQAYPNCDAALADINLDSQVNAFDIDAFVNLLTP